MLIIPPFDYTMLIIPQYWLYNVDNTPRKVYIDYNVDYRSNEPRPYLEAVTQRFSIKKVLLDIWQNSGKNLGQGLF